MDYVKSEGYRMARKKALYGTMIISLALVFAAIMALYFSLKADANFPYGTNRFLYLNVVTSLPFIVLIGLLLNRQLLGRDKEPMKYMVAYGITRKQIYFTKLGLTVTSFLILCLLGIALVVFGGESLLTSGDGWREQFFLAVGNMIPLALAGFVCGHTLMILSANDMLAVLGVLALFTTLPSKLLGTVELAIYGQEVGAKLMPGALMEQVNANFLAQEGVLLPQCFVIGLGLLTLSLGSGIVLFDKKEL